MRPPIDTTETLSALKASQGCNINNLCDVLGMNFKEVRGRIRALRDKKIVISVGRGKICGWYTVKYYLANKKELDKKHHVRPKHLLVKKLQDKDYDIFSDWCQRNVRLNQLMLRPSI